MSIGQTLVYFAPFVSPAILQLIIFKKVYFRYTRSLEHLIVEPEDFNK